MRALIMVGLVAGALAGCGGAGPPIPVRGDVTLLEGQWIGEYSSEESGRSGSIVFTLQTGSNTAFGDVIMVPADPTDRALGFERNPEQPTRRPSPQLLTIRFVQVSGNRLIGDLEQYQDPDCGCLLSTTFTGKLNGDVLEGTYRSFHSPERHTVLGRWRATRTRN